MTTLAARPKTFAEAEQVLAARLPGYTERPQQQALAAFVEKVIAEGGHGLAEAGCGTGKSLATMIPAILNGKRTVVATATKALMEQYASKDVPFLEENLGVPFTWALVKGRSNYLCRAKALEADSSRVTALPGLLQEIEEDPEHSGDFEHFATPVPDDQRYLLASTSADCPGKQTCPFGNACFAEAAKQKGREAQVVITNTAMLLTDLVVRELTDGNAMMLGDYDLVLIDEAHETEEYATSALNKQIKYTGIMALVGEAANFARSLGEDLSGPTSRVSLALVSAWDLLGEGALLPLGFFLENDTAFVELIESLAGLAEALNNLSGSSTEMLIRRSRLARRATNYADGIGMAATSDDELMVRWVETSTDRAGQTHPMLCMAPVHVGPFLSEWLWDTTSAVLISATLSVHGDFGYISHRLGLPGSTQSLSVGTPFDYEKQALLFVPPASAPSPKDRSSWLGYSATMTRELVAASGGGALLLFTSRSAMEQAYENLAPVFESMGLTCLIQRAGGMTKKRLSEEFSSDVHSVLFALKSFMTGVDFQGDSCRLVVIDKLPFPVPTEPVFAARADQIRRYGGNDFADLTIPIMTLTLEQAYGRLIRTSQDRGVVAILDSRLSSTGYGKKIVRSLPDSPATTTLADVQAFYEVSRAVAGD